jgi:hypothetical protein
VGESRSPFNDRIFDKMATGSDNIGFEEYVRVMAEYCMYTKVSILLKNKFILFFIYFFLFFFLFTPFWLVSMGNRFYNITLFDLFN